MNNVDELTEKCIVQEAMIKYGGSFAHSLGIALVHADNVNRIKIKTTFNTEWNDYLKLGIEDKSINPEE